MSQQEATRISSTGMMGGLGFKASNLPKCAACDIVETADQKLLTCGRCKKTRYCTKSCQTENWESNKSTCKSQNYILKFSLCPTEITNPSVNRTLSCPVSATFHQLHRTLQTAFGWASTHTYDFKIKDANAEPQPEAGLADVVERSMRMDSGQDTGPRRTY